MNPVGAVHAHDPLRPCPVGPAARAWLEARVGWILDHFGADRARALPVVLPDELLRERFDGSEDAAGALFETVRARLGLAGEDLELGFYEEGAPSPAWAGDAMNGSFTAGHFVAAAPGERQVVGLNRAKLDDPVALVATIAHELAHVLLIGQRRISSDVVDHEPLTDLLTVFSGFGVFTANSVIRERNTELGWSVGNLGYLRQEELAYALALLAHLRGEARPPWASALCGDVRAWFDESLAFLAGREVVAPGSSRALAPIDFAALWDAAIHEQAPPRAHVPWALLLVVLAPLGLCLTGLLLPPWLEARWRVLHVVNGTPWPATVLVGLAPRGTEVAPYTRRTLEVGEGRHALRVVTPHGVERLDIVMETTWAERDGDLETVFVVNVLGAAAIVDEDIHYGQYGQGGPPPTPRVEHLVGETFVVVPGVADPFRDPPRSIGGGQSKTRRWVRWDGEGLTTDVVVRDLHEHAPTTAHDLLALQRRLRPDDVTLRELETTLCAERH